jgi:outer membrane lipoprotein-sorting protein
MKTSKFLLALTGCAVYGLVYAQGATAADLTAEQIIEKHIEATGGRAAYAKQTSLLMKGTIEMTGQSITGTITTYQKSPDKILVLIALTGLGDIRQGYDGKIAWSEDPFNGLQKLEGAEKARMAREAGNSILRAKEIYKSIEVVGKEKVGERQTYKVKLTPKEGKPSYQYFDTETFLALRADSTQESAGGTVEVQAYLSDYRAVDGVKMPFKSKIVMPQGDMVVTITEAKSNVVIADAKFAYPGKPNSESKPK